MNLVFNLILKDILNKEIFFVLEKRVIALFMTIFLRNEKVLVLTPTQGTVAVHGNNRLKTMAWFWMLWLHCFLDLNISIEQKSQNHWPCTMLKDF